jgi:tetratricopeptide (TPR) repeat protein/ribosomal protein L40E
MLICEPCGIEYPPGKKFCRKCGGTLLEQAPAGQTCPQCGETTPAGKKFCRKCGFLLSAAEPQPEAVCPSCGSPVQPNKRFCGACGAVLGATLKLTPVPPPEIPSEESAPPPEEISTQPEETRAWAAAATASVEAPPAPEPPAAPTVVARSPFAAMIESAEPLPEAVVHEEPPPPTQVAPPRPAPPEPCAEEESEVPVTVAPEHPEPPAPYVAPPREAEAEAAPMSKLLWILAAAAIVLALGLAGAWYFFLSAEARLLSAIEKGRLAGPDADSAYSLYLKAKAAKQMTPALQQKIRERALDKLSNSGEALLKKRMEVASFAPPELEELRRTYEWAFELAPDDAQVAARKDYVFGLLALVNERPHEALEPLRASLDKNPGWAPGWQDLGRALLRTNEPVRAMNAFERAISLAPDWVEPHLDVGALYMQNQAWQEAERLLLRAAELDTTLAAPWYLLGQTYEGSRDCARAIAAYEKAAELGGKRPSPAFRVEAAQSRATDLRAQCTGQQMAAAGAPPPSPRPEARPQSGATPSLQVAKPAPAPRMELGTVATCSAFRGFGDFTARPQVRPGESFCVYAEVLNANRGGAVDLVFSYAILSAANEAVLRRSSQLAHRTNDASVAWAAEFRMPADAQPGIYTVTVSVRSELSGETQTKSAYFTVLPRP